VESKNFFSDLQRTRRAFQTELLSFRKGCGRQTHQRAGSLDTLRRYRPRHVVEPFENAFLVPRQKAGVEEIANRTHHRIVSIRQIVEAVAQGWLRGSKPPHLESERGISARQILIASRRHIESEPEQGLHLDPHNRSPATSQDTQKVAAEASRRNDNPYRRRQILETRSNQPVDLIEEPPLGGTSASAGDDTGSSLGG
jgi:hypothetical protein